MEPYKNGIPCDKTPKGYLPRTEQMIFKKKFLNLSNDLDSWPWDFKDEFFPFRSDILITLMCLIVVIGSINRALVVLQKTNNVVVRCRLC